MKFSDYQQFPSHVVLCSITSDFDAALISETHLEREKLVTAAKEARKFSCAGAGSAAISTASNGTSAGVLAMVRTRWFSKPLSICADEAGVLCTTPRLAGRVIRVMGMEILMTAYFEHSIGFRSDINANLMQDLCFLTRDGKLPFILGGGFNFPPSLWQDLSMHRGSLWLRKLGASVVIPQGTTHTCRTGKGQKPDIIDYFLVSTLIRPLRRKCEIVKSVFWGPHYGVELTLNINFGSVVSRQLIGKFSKRNRHNTNALQGQNTQHTEEADPALWNEARRNCVFEGKKPRCQDGQEDTKLHAPNMLTRVVSWKRQMSWATLWRPWSDATNQYWVKVGRMCQTPSSGKFGTFRMKPASGETFMQLGCAILEGGSNAELRAWKAFGQWVNTIRTRMPPEKLLSSFKVATPSARR